ncbi:MULTISPECIES: Ig-like domain repeat protein [unclassified Polaromonas]|uniref:Ig-like domain repeat protein n=1 Tax=unclassified Polaromonas TaxID=2638319 RepID=UPI000F092D0C|nr:MULTISPECIES: Ig-like domain repeat protein [unclassified Polaromonas]AYQ29532.1 type IV secretion protein Rhs [Polaromonas sp. SP1]QGJ19354.1 type IV secretion protein Rhs [Polaromonas sp. Pch-P]
MSSPSPIRAFTAWLSRLALLIIMAPAMAIAATPTTTALSSSAGTAPVGQSITLTATVTGASPTGTVTFKDGATTVGSGAVTAGVATLNSSALALGSHTLTAEYAGDANNDPSTSAGVTVVINTGTLTWQFGYDAMGRPTTVLDPNGLASYTYYDRLGRPIQTQQPANTGSATPTTTSFAYNANDSLTQVTDPRSLNTSYTPNGLGDVTAQTSPDTGASQYTYDANGNVLTKTDARGKLTQYAYDNLDRLKRVQYPTGTDTLIEYDGGSTPTPAAVGELTKITDASGQAVYTYDSMGRKTGKTQTTGAKTFTVGYTWGDTGTALDKLTAITYPSGTKINYSYNAYGDVSGITVNPPNANGVGTNTGTSLPMISAITQNAESKLTGWTWASAKTQAIAYDGNGEIAAYNLGDSTGTGSAAGIRRTVTRDSAGRITGYTHISNGTAVPALDQSFGYDNLNRLISATQNGTAIQYSYDATGNRTAKAVSGTSYPNTISATSNKLTQTQDAGGTATIQHDAAGNITSDGTNTYTYTDRGRLATMINAGGTVSYSYNALELRVAKTGPTALVPTGATYYVYDESGKLLGEYDVNGTPLYETIYLGLPVGVIKQTGTAAGGNIAIGLYNVSTDQIGAPRIITRQLDEAVVWRWDTAEVFGATAPDQNPSGSGTFNFNQRLPGQVFDAESGLFQNWNREYNPRIGRYMQSDPIGLRGGINTYAYVDGNPVVMVDPSGLAGSFVGQLGGSYVPGIGGEGNVGVFVGTYNGRLDFGFYTQGGISVGVQSPGVSGQVGAINGDVNTIRGITKNINVSAPLACGTAMTTIDVQGKTKLVGVTVGLGSKLGGSMTYSDTAAWSMQEAIDRMIDRLVSHRK